MIRAGAWRTAGKGHASRTFRHLVCENYSVCFFLRQNFPSRINSKSQFFKVIILCIYFSFSCFWNNRRRISCFCSPFIKAIARDSHRNLHSLFFVFVSATDDFGEDRVDCYFALSLCWFAIDAISKRKNFNYSFYEDLQWFPWSHTLIAPFSVNLVDTVSQSVDADARHFSDSHLILLVHTFTLGLAMEGRSSGVDV